MKIDRRCHCGFITFEAEIRSPESVALPLHRLPDACRISLPRCGSFAEGCIHAALGRGENLREVWNEWSETTSRALPRVRIANRLDVRK